MSGKNLIEEFAGKSAVKALAAFVSSSDKDKFDKAAEGVAVALGSSKKEFDEKLADPRALLESFKSNFALLIQKTWVEKTDALLKESVARQLDEFCDCARRSWKKSYKPFLDTIYSAVYLMFGQQAKLDDFGEYALRIDPEFGVFWWYVESLPKDADWPEQKCKDAISLGMYFLANY